MGVAPIDRFVAIPRVTPPTADAARKPGRFGQAAVTLWETLRLALDSLRAHKLRSFLTLFGVIMAVTTLVVVMSAIAGLNLYVANRVANLGANVFIVDRFGIITSMDEFQKAQKRPLITFDDYMRLRETMQTAEAVAAIDDRNAQTRSGDIKMENTDVMGASANFADVRNIDVAQGRFITPADDEHHSEVVFIGADLASKFFPNVDPIGKTIRAETHTYQVVGVAEPFGTAFGESQDNYMIIPLNTYTKQWHRQSDWLTIFVQSPSAENWPSPVAWGAQAAHRLAIHDRVCGARGGRRIDWSAVCLPRDLCRAGVVFLPDDHPHRRGDFVLGCVHGGGTFLRDLSCDPGGETRSHRSAAGRGIRRQTWHRRTART